MRRLQLLAERTARSLITDVGTRIAHTEQVARNADWIARHHRLCDADADYLVAAAWLHDIGYAPRLIDTGMHAVDGARWLRTQPLYESFAAIVAWHSTSEAECQLRRIDLPGEFTPPSTLMRDLLWIADFTASPTGQHVSVYERVAEISGRYEPGTAVARALVASLPALRGALLRVTPAAADDRLQRLFA